MYYICYSKLTRWCRGNVALLVQDVPGSIPSSGKGFYVWFFVVLYFFVQNYIICLVFFISFATLIYLVYLTYCNIFYR